VGMCHLKSAVDVKSAWGEGFWLQGCPQNPSMAGVGRALCGSPSPAPCPEQAVQDLIQAGFEYQLRRPHSEAHAIQEVPTEHQ